MNKNIEIKSVGEFQVANRQGRVIKRGNIEDCRDFLRNNSQFQSSFAIICQKK